MQDPAPHKGCPARLPGVGRGALLGPGEPLGTPSLEQLKCIGFASYATPGARSEEVTVLAQKPQAGSWVRLRTAFPSKAALVTRPDVGFCCPAAACVQGSGRASVAEPVFIKHPPTQTRESVQQAAPAGAAPCSLGVVMRVILIFTGVSCVLQKQLCANHVLFLYLKVRKSSRRILDIFSFPTHPLEQCGCFSHGSKAGSQAALLAPPGPWLRPRLRWGSSGQGPPPSGGAPPSCLWSGPRPHGQLPLRGQGHQSTPRGSEWSLACVPGASAHPLGCILGPAGLDLPAAPGAPIWRTGTRICPGVYLWLSKLSRQLSRSVRPWVWGLVFFEGGSQVFNRGLGGGQAVRGGWLGAGLYGRLAYSRAFTGPHWPQ